jgi:uncharacterized CHY-type Zn-finger protein
MSQYITSFIIEPVARQARRFSRPSSQHTNDPSTPRPSVQPTEFPEYVDPLEENAVETVPNPPETSNTIQSIPIIPRLEESHGVISDSSQHDVRTRAETDPEAIASQERQIHRFRERFVSSAASFPTRVNEAGMRIMEESEQSQTTSTRRQSTRDSVGDTELPEDDGMMKIRKKIIEIQEMDIPITDKSRLMHQLMMERYMSHGGGQTLRAQSPSSLRSHERPFTPVSNQSNDLIMTDSPDTAVSLSRGDELKVTPQDKEPTYYLQSSTPGQSRKNSVSINGDDRPFGCSHYKRNVKLQCSACNQWYTCRFCHDQTEDHCMNRPATKNMLCMYCGTAQRAAQDCKFCGESAAWYFCKICKLWDDDTSKSIYHCNGCGICRRGEGLGKDFFHCEVRDFSLIYSITKS